MNKKNRASNFVLLCTISFCWVTFFVFSVSFAVYAATAGLPFSEDFTSSNLMDPALTTANWSVSKEKLLLKFKYGSLNSANGFTPKTDFGSSSDYSYGIACGDLNHDGNQDLVVANVGISPSNPGIVNKIFLGQGDGTFATSISLGSSDTDHSLKVALGDLNGDGNLDAVFANSNETDKIYFGNGDGTFSGSGQAVNSSDTLISTGVALGDLDHDGDLDIVIAVHSGENRAYLNQGDGTFTAAKIFGISSNQTLSVALGDIDNDGDLDIVTANDGQANYAYINPGSGDVSAFTVQAIGPPANSSMDICLTDLNGDGKPDVVVANDGINYAYMGNGDGTFPTAAAIGGSDTDNSASISVADFDHDGDLDIVFATNNRTEPNKLYLNAGDGSFPDTGLQISAATYRTVCTASADFDGDGDQDLAFINYDTTTAHKIYLNDADKLFAVNGSNVSSGTLPTYGGNLCDLNGDGSLDLITANKGEHNKVYLGSGHGEFSAGINVGSDTDDSIFLICADFNNDGKLDIITANDGQTNKIYLGSGDGDFSSTTGSAISAATRRTIRLVSGDFDSDGNLDLIIANYSDIDYLCLGNGDGTFQSEIALGVSDPTYSLIAGDIDNDGDLDLITAALGINNKIYINNGNGGFAAAVEIAADSSHNDTCDVLLGDFNENGNLDLITINYGQICQIHPGNGDGSFQSGSDIGTIAYTSYRTTMGDLNGDGHLDLVLGNLSGANRFFLGNGDGSFSSTAVEIDSEAYGSSAVFLGDFDSDGDLDLITTNSGTTATDTNKIYLGNRAGICPESRPVAVPEICNNTTSAATGDIDNDGNLDLVVANSQGDFAYLGNGNGTFSSSFNRLGSGANASKAIGLGDFNEDGILDAVTANYNKTNKIYLGNGDGSFSAGSAVSSAVSSSWGLAIGDLNRDGHLDLLIANNLAVNQVYFGNGDGTFAGTANSFGTAASPTRDLGLGDFNHDGNLDVVTAESGAANRVFLGDGSGSFSPSFNLSSDTNATETIAVYDLDRDGFLDIVTGNNSAADRIFLGKQDGSGRFIAPPDNTLGNDPSSTGGLAVGDLNRDGYPDIAVTNINVVDKVYYGNASADYHNSTGFALGDETEPDYPILLGDLNNDGDLDIITGDNSGLEPNLIYNAGGYCAVCNLVGSKTVDSESGNIYEVTFTVSATTPLHTWIDWYLTNDGGNHWYKVKANSNFVFPSTGSDLRWRARLNSRSPRYSPAITEVKLEMVPPEITDQTVTAANNSADLSNTVDPHSLTTESWFVWGLTTAYSDSTGSTNIGSSTAVSSNFTISGLDSRTVYHCRSVATSDAGTSYGDDIVFMTGSSNSGDGSHKPARIEGKSEYDTVNSAFSTAGDGDTIKLWAAVINGDAEFDSGSADTVTLQGGWNADYSLHGGNGSTISGTLTIISGCLLVDGVTLQ